MLVFFALPLLALLPESLSDGGTAFGRVIGDNLFFAAMRNTILLGLISGAFSALAGMAIANDNACRGDRRSFA